MFILLPDSEYLLRWRRKWTRETFLSAARVSSGSYFHELMNRLYDCLLSDLVDVRIVYEKYYHDEYPDIVTFASKCLCIDEEKFRPILDHIKEDDTLGYGSLKSGGDNSLSFLISPEWEGDRGFQMLQAVFNEMEKTP